MDTCGSETKRSQWTFPFSKNNTKKLSHRFCTPGSTWVWRWSWCWTCTCQRKTKVGMVSMAFFVGACFQHSPGLHVALFQAHPKPFYWKPSLQSLENSRLGLFGGNHNPGPHGIFGCQKKRQGSSSSVLLLGAKKLVISDLPICRGCKQVARDALPFILGLPWQIETPNFITKVPRATAIIPAQNPPKNCHLCWHGWVLDLNRPVDNGQKNMAKTKYKQRIVWNPHVLNIFHDRIPKLVWNPNSCWGKD